MNCDPFIVLWLEAPLQAWGCDSKFYRRESLDFPTKSGVLGLVCCALGAGGAQIELLKAFAPLIQHIFAFRHTEEVSPILYDFQTVGNGYNNEDSWEKLFIPKTCEGKAASGASGSKITLRGYVQDMAFGVILQIPDDKKECISQAFQNPAWDLYLGRKNCAPTDFIYRGIFDTVEQSEEAIFAIAKTKGLQYFFKVIDGDYPEVGETFILRDVPIQFGDHKKYMDRKVTKIRVL